MKPCAHLRIEYAEPNGPKSSGKCMDCDKPMPPLPNSPIPYANPFGARSKHRALTIRQWPQRRSKR